jgi:hypothetical protein
MDGMPGWSVGARHPDPSLTRFSDIKIFNRVLLSKAGANVAGTRYWRSQYYRYYSNSRHKPVEVKCQILVPIFLTPNTIGFFQYKWFDEGVGWFRGARVGELACRPVSKRIMTPRV